ncbi:MAG: hypothetical protein GX117_05170 [Candidatus Hydrogenedentes bacterium]|jgi:hypothetical protein|nr:hypothetical protein [Candidatus Hydrogenedentota bacterium]
MNLSNFYFLNVTLRYYLPTAAIALLILYYLLRRESVQQFLGSCRQRAAYWILTGILAVVGLFSVFNYVATDYYRFDSYLNAYEFYHYYIGTKYAREVGYTEMYAASLVADSETGMKWKDKTGTLRDLSTGQRVNHKQILDNAAFYKDKFSPERWEEFKKDIVWFKDRLVQHRWNGILRDKGYNGTPVWTMLVGSFLSNRISTDSEWGMLFLSLLDPLLILITFLIVLWAFGPRTALLMIVLLGTNYMMKWWHMKGAYLRTDWAMCLVMSAALIRKNKLTAAGILTGYAALARIFPAVLVIGILAKLFWNLMELFLKLSKKLYKRLGFPQQPLEVRLLGAVTLVFMLVLLGWRSLCFFKGVALPWLGSENPGVGNFFSFLFSNEAGYSPVLQVGVFTIWLLFGVVLAVIALWGFWKNLLKRKYVYFLIAFALTCGVLLGASQVFWKGTDYWQQYTTKIAKHNTDISTWRVGYKYIFMADFGDDFSYINKAFVDWQPKVRSQWYQEKQSQWWETQILILLLTVLACIGLKDYRAYILGFVPLFFLVSPTYYYYIMLLLPLLFFAPRIEQGRYGLGLALMYLTGMSGYWFYDLWKQNYGTYYWLSFQVLIMVLYMLALAYIENIRSFMEMQKTGETPKKDEDGAPQDDESQAPLPEAACPQTEAL